MDFNHGQATANNNIGELINAGEVGMITAYLPEGNTFAVWFGNNRWYTFKESEEWFLGNFTVKYDAE